MSDSGMEFRPGTQLYVPFQRVRTGCLRVWYRGPKAWYVLREFGYRNQVVVAVCESRKMARVIAFVFAP